MYWYKLIYKIKAVLVAIAISTVFLFSCTENSTKETADTSSEKYFDIKGYFEKEILQLSTTDTRIEKTVGKDGDYETKVIQIEDWDKELGSFYAIDLNKPAYTGQFTVTQDSLSMQYTANSPKLDIRSIQIKYIGDEVSQIIIHRQIDNMLYSTEERLEYSKNNFYKINKVQNIVVLGTNKYSIQGKLKQ